MSSLPRDQGTSQQALLPSLNRRLGTDIGPGAGRAGSRRCRENFYGDVAKQIGGDDVAVTSILSNPDEDPHLFEASPSVARAISAAKIVIASGADYDPWVQKLLGAARAPTAR